MEHPITPPQGKFKRWEDDILNERENVDVVLDCAWKDGYSAGADAELEACCDYMQREDFHGFAKELRTARRPKPPSLAEEALEVVTSLRLGECVHRNGAEMDVLTAALERLQQYEQENNDN